MMDIDGNLYHAILLKDDEIRNKVNKNQTAGDFVSTSGSNYLMLLNEVINNRYINKNGGKRQLT